MGFVPDPEVTPEKVREMMLAEGIRPEENLFSSDIIRMRYGAYEEEERRMALKPPVDAKSMRMDKRALRKAIAEMNRQMGFEKDPEATAEKAQEMMLALGIRPEENTASREIIRMRGEKFEQE